MAPDAIPVREPFPARVPRSPANDGREDETSARIAVVKLISFMIWLKENELLQSA